MSASPGLRSSGLPVVDVVDAVIEGLDANRPTVLVAPPGAGKTTLVPLLLLDSAWAARGRIVMLEPRRLATRASARRMAQLLGEEVGETVGYQTRDERRVGPRTRIEVVTEGILTRRLQSDPELPGTAAVIFDEIHERNLPTDLGLALALDARDTIRPDLRLLAMSATPDVAALERVLGDPVVVTSEGRSFDVDLRYVARRKNDRLEDATADAVRRALDEESGDVLVFLPGIGEIRRTEERLRGLDPRIDVRPLAGSLSPADQDAALAPSPPGRRKIVLSTDIAETSLTVEGVRVVVDSGLARAPRFDAGTGMTRLKTVTTSRSSATQRAGRAGRTEPGVCYRLWSKMENTGRPAHPTPEIESADLAGFALELSAWGSDDLRFVSEPPKSAMRAARELLAQLGAVDDGGITDLGRRMLGLPVHPRLARMLALDPSPLTCAVAVLLEERDVFRGGHHAPASLTLRVEVLSGRHGHDRADRGAVHRLRDRARDLARRLGIGYDDGRIDPDRTGAALLTAFPDRLAIRRGPGRFQLRIGTSVWVPETDVLAGEEFLVAADLDGKRKNARIRRAAGIDPADVASVLEREVTSTVDLRWDDARDDLVQVTTQRLGAMTLAESVRRATPGEETTAALLDRVAATGLAVLGWSGKAVSLRRRVEYLHRTVGEPWPDWSAEALVGSRADWLGPFLGDAAGRGDLERLDVHMILRSGLPWPQGADLDRLAPSELELPSGRTVPVDYGDGRPVARARVQDLFGVTEHPTAGGEPIVLELLSPADRPIQITADLPGFWAGSWSEVRKDLAGRYPKHQWPDDPASAEPRRLRRDR